MNLRVIIPVKPFGEAKQRLAPVMNSTQRAHLAERMFRHVLDTASAVVGAANVLVVSRSQEVLAIAETETALGLLESEPSDLNAALLQAVRFANAHGDPKILVLASDLPLVEESDLAEMIKHDCAIAPDRHERGTNALVWHEHLPFHFGQDSFARHLASAKHAGLIPEIIVRRGLSHDVDVPEDLIDSDNQANLFRRRGSTRSA